MRNEIKLTQIKREWEPLLPKGSTLRLQWLSPRPFTGESEHWEGGSQIRIARAIVAHPEYSPRSYIVTAENHPFWGTKWSARS